MSDNVDSLSLTPGKDDKTPPTLNIAQKPFKVAKPVSKEIKNGTGEAIGDHAVLEAKHVIFSGKDGAVINSSYGDTPSTLRVGDADTPPFFTDAVKGKKIGCQVMVAVPAKDTLSEQQLPKGLTLDDTVVFVIDVVGSRPYLEKAEGTPVPPKAGLPTAEVPDDMKQPAKISVPSPTPIKETVTQPLIAGKGKKIEKGQHIRIRYTGVTWREPGKPFDYSGKAGPGYAEFPIGAGQLIKAWDEGIVGQTVGSRLLLVVQPADGYGAKGGANGAIKGDDVLIFVVDVLDAGKN
ncbi:FKBP-type peptidyl-prolyl cis-trans isomerase [Austwickia sp. TVS 96-490-7B]|uniref:FKBP-type peptidyl-prolyl cis-trans isomerase n=1 Tax=Austwickia sp. TVS 96-490-7B TaxID=2830843 RepID=UPI001C55A6A9|nr:FKBP-type peptidyl-prolyl cis-trans isomerase [Austwickia sp. TVS 96-490-7B]